MEKIIISIFLFSLLLFTACAITAPNECETLALKLDSNIMDTNNPPGRLIISGNEGFVAGTLLEVKEYGFDESSNYYAYDLTFAGKNKQGNLYLITNQETITLQIGTFYKFDLANVRQNGKLAGSFIDENLDKFQAIVCQ